MLKRDFFSPPITDIPFYGFLICVVKEPDFFGGKLEKVIFYKKILAFEKRIVYKRLY